VFEEVPEGQLLVINKTIPDTTTLATVPALLLNNLPRLPDNLQYRFMARHIVLMDGDTRIIVDYILNVLRLTEVTPDALTRRTLLSLTGQCLVAAAAETVSSVPQPTRRDFRDHIALRLRSALPNVKDSIKFAVIGDSGTGGREQYQIGKLLNDARARFPYEFVTMMGDNMYGGQGPSDFVKKFETPYKTILDAGVNFYATLGNHDDRRSASTSRSTWKGSATTPSGRATSNSSSSTAPTWRRCRWTG
jgi:hypothetical protein